MSTAGPLRGVMLPVVVALQALGIAGWSNAAHEAVHGHLWRSRSLNLLWGRLLHGVLLLDHDVHRRYHLSHHAHLGEHEDPECQFGFADLGGRRGYICRTARWALPPSPLHIANWTEAWATVRMGHNGPRGLPRRSALAGAVVPVASTLLWLAWLLMSASDAVLVGFLPLLVVAPLLGWWTALPEHVGLAGNPQGERSRNVGASRVLQFTLWNFNLHATHHRWPVMHFRQLPVATGEALVAPKAISYVAFHRELWNALAPAHERSVATRIGRQ